MLNLVKRYLIFAVIIGVIYWITPIFFQGENYKYDAIEYQFLFPATALVSGLVFSWKNGVDFTFPLIAPIIFIIHVLIFSHYYHWHIYVFIYLIVGMLGCFIGDMAYKADMQEKQEKENAKKEGKEPYKIKISNISVISVDEDNNK